MLESDYDLRAPITGVPLDFFFSSRRRHTIFDCDWSSDVCSSDLAAVARCRHGPRDGGGAHTHGMTVMKTLVALVAIVVLSGCATTREGGSPSEPEIGRASCRERV